MEEPIEQVKLKMIGINNPNKHTRTDGNREYTEERHD